ncbi:MAG: 50S ribosomal protein L32e [Candidatus Thorarchaeota archaeon]|nr:50S ribosomal protein L32e [Candidatus Thorarchaeota archaeon]
MSKDAKTPKKTAKKSEDTPEKEPKKTTAKSAEKTGTKKTESAARTSSKKTTEAVAEKPKTAKTEVKTRKAPQKSEAAVKSESRKKVTEPAAKTTAEPRKRATAKAAAEPEVKTTSRTKAEAAPKKRTPAVTKGEEPAPVTMTEARPKEKKPKAEKAEPVAAPPKVTKTVKKAPSKMTKAVPAEVPKKEEPLTSAKAIRGSRLWRITQEKKKRQPAFRHEQAHRWRRIKNSWRKVRGIDNLAREKRKGRIALVNPGYRKPVAVRAVHPSGYIEVLVSRPTDIDGLDPMRYAVRIDGHVGVKKRQEIIKRSEAASLRVLNPGAPETAVTEEELFSELEGVEELEAEKK